MSGTITMTKHELEELQIRCAKEGACQALAQLGLDDPEAVHDVKDMRDLIKAYRATRSLIWATIIKYATMFVLGALAYGIFAKARGE